jgi:Tol biopolymer transport system component
MGKHESAIEMAQKAQQLMEGSTLPLWTLGYALGRAGKRAEAEAVAEKLKALSNQVYVSPYYQALVYTGLGDRESAFAYLEKAVEARDEWLLWLGTEPKLDDLRSDPRFAVLLKKVGLKGDESDKALSYSGEHSAVQTFKATGDVPTSTSEISPATPTVAEAVYAVYRNFRKQRIWIFGIILTALLLGATYVAYQLTQGSVQHFSTISLNKLTATGNIANITVSPDGKYAAYVVAESGRQGLWVRQIAIANSIRLVTPTPGQYRGLTFSRDGNYIYYVFSETNARDGTLYRVPALGGSVTELKKDVDSGISFSPDGKQFAFIRSNSDTGTDDLVIANGQSNTEQKLASRSFPEHFSVQLTPTWSPDGEIITAVTQTADESGFFLKIAGISPTNSSEKLLSSGRWLEINAMDWLPDGTAFVISAQDSSSAFYHLWSISYPQGRDRRITNDLNDYLSVSISSQAPLLLSIQRQTLTNIWLAPRSDLTRPVQLTSGAGMFFDLCWTSDGKILYASDASGNADIWEMAGDGTNQQQITAGAGRNYAPVASHDGKYIVFHSNRTGRWQVWRMDRDGSNPMQLTTGNEDSNWPEISPDSRWVFFEHVDSGVPTLWRVSIDGGAAVQITRSLSMRPNISADGKSIAYWHKAQTPNAPWQIAVMPLGSSSEVKLLDVPQSAANGLSALQISPEGDSVLFIDLRNGVSNLLSQPLAGGPAQHLTSFPKEQFYSFDLSSDGRMVVSRGIRTTDAVLITDTR